MEKSRLLYSPETPLGQDVQSLLMQHPEALLLDEIRRQLATPDEGVAPQMGKMGLNLEKCDIG